MVEKNGKQGAPAVGKKVDFNTKIVEYEVSLRFLQERIAQLRNEEASLIIQAQKTYEALQALRAESAIKSPAKDKP